MNERRSEVRVSDLMTRAVYTLTPVQSLPLAESIMELLHLRHIPVVDAERRVVGLVTHRDVLAARISSLTPLSAGERSELQLAVPVARIMRTNVWTIPPDALAINAARIMRDHRFGCLPVVEDGRLVGILTEADLLVLVTDMLFFSGERPPVPLTLERAMTPVPVTLAPDASLREARLLMSRHGIRHLPVLEGGKAVAMITDRDLSIAEAIFQGTPQTRAAHAVRLVGNPRVHAVSVATPLDAVLRDMFRERLEAVLVYEGDHLAGIFTAIDACRALADGLAPG